MCDRSERLAEEFRPGDDKSQKVNSEIFVIWDKLEIKPGRMPKKEPPEIRRLFLFCLDDLSSSQSPA